MVYLREVKRAAIRVFIFKFNTMKRILNKWDKFKLGRRLHYLQKRLHRAEENGYQDKIDKYNRYIREVQEKLRHIKE